MAINNRKKVKTRISVGVVNILATFNNTMISICDPYGNVLLWSSAGKNKFKGSRKSTPYAAQVAADEVGRRALEIGMKTVEVNIKGLGGGREASLRALQACGLQITTIRDKTPLPHNGCRPSKRRRV